MKEPVDEEDPVNGLDMEDHQSQVDIGVISDSSDGDIEMPFDDDADEVPNPIPSLFGVRWPLSWCGKLEDAPELNHRV